MNKVISKFDNDAVQDKKLDAYDWESNDFLASQELMVTITLGEYRALISEKAVADEKILASNKKALDSEAIIKELKKEVDRLKAENYDLQTKVMDATLANCGEIAKHSECASLESEG